MLVSKYKYSYNYMVTTATLLARYSNTAYLSRNAILKEVCNKCLGGNNWRSPRTFWATTLTIYSFCLNNYRNYWTIYHWQCSTQCGYCKKGTPAHYCCDVMRYLHSHYPSQWIAWNDWLCGLYNTQSHSCQLLPMEPSEEQCLCPKM
jgi:hypothetical protein